MKKLLTLFIFLFFWTLESYSFYVFDRNLELVNLLSDEDITIKKIKYYLIIDQSKFFEQEKLNALSKNLEYRFTNDYVDSRPCCIKLLNSPYFKNTIQILRLKLEKEKAKFTSKNNRILVIVLIALVLSSLLALFFVLKNRRNEKKLIGQIEVNYLQKIENIENLKKLDLTNAVLVGESSERKRLARELHDGLGSNLSALKINISSFKSKSRISSEDLEKIEMQIDITIKELREISHNLLPETLLKLGLEKALIDLCEKLNSERLKIELQLYGIGQDLSEKFQITVFRIIQELLNNTIKHSEATEALVSCVQDGDIFLITVEDDGKGFDKSEIIYGIGLENIRNRVKLLNGIFEIDSDESGARFYIEFNDSRTIKII